MSVIQKTVSDAADIELAMEDLVRAKDHWAQTSIEQRLELLKQVKDQTAAVAEAWANKAAQMKQIPEGSPLCGEEWLSGPYTVLGACNALINTLRQMEGKTFLNSLPTRSLDSGQVATRVLPHSFWDHLLLSGVKAELWMQTGVNADNLSSHTAGAYETDPASRKGSVSLVLGAGNIAAITPLDCFHKLFLEHSVVVLKMNPVNDYLKEFFDQALAPLIEIGALRIVCGGGDVGAMLCEHPAVESIHITGAKSTHDLIVWGSGAEAAKRKQLGTPINKRDITSELGAVCPTIVVPGNWSKKDIQFQAEQVATQKLHNSGFNCVASQVLILPKKWEKTPVFIEALRDAMRHVPDRGCYYPGGDDRLSDFDAAHKGCENLASKTSETRRLLVDLDQSDNPSVAETNEIFAPALCIKYIDDDGPQQFLQDAIAYSNEKLFGTLGGNIVVDPRTRKSLHKQWDGIIAEFRYGCVAINAWTGLGFLSPVTSWGAFPGDTLENTQSGIGVVHNTFMFDKVERTVIEAPFRPFPRNLLHGSCTLLPRPPWFVTNRKAAILGKLLTRFQHKPSLLKIPRIFLNALLG